MTKFYSKYIIKNDVKSIPYIFDVVNTDYIDDTPFRNQEYSEIRTKYTLKTNVNISEIEKIINLASKFCTVNLAVIKILNKNTILKLYKNKNHGSHIRDFFVLFIIFTITAINGIITHISSWRRI